jgi:formylglycine-generating enzyme required for sulfatase activity
VTNVSWFAARAYASWTGRRLPTLEEWEFVAAAGETKLDGRRDPGFDRPILDWYSKPGSHLPGPVGAGPANFWGVEDMHGLVWEWLDDFNTIPLIVESPGNAGLNRQVFCGNVSVGPAGPRDFAALMRFEFRGSLEASHTIKDLGFRCVADEEGLR